MKLKHIISAILILFFFNTQKSSAQLIHISPPMLQVYANVKEVKGNGLNNIKNAEIFLYIDTEKNGNWEFVKKMKSSGSGDFTCNLDLNAAYMIEVAKKDFVTKKITFDTNVYNLTNTPEPFYFIMDMVVDDGTKYTKPVANVFFNREKQVFDFEIDYTKASAEK